MLNFIKKNQMLFLLGVIVLAGMIAHEFKGRGLKSVPQAQKLQEAPKEEKSTAPVNPPSASENLAKQMESPEDSRVERVSLKEEGPEVNPFCSEQSSFSILPAAYLKYFKLAHGSHVLLPKKFEDCFILEKNRRVVFFEYSPSFKMAWNPLVSMQTTVMAHRDIPSFFSAKKEILDGTGKEQREEVEKYFGNLERIFSENLSGPWVELKFSVDSMETVPTFWPKSPPDHAVAKMISSARFQEMKQDLSNVYILDVRNREDKDKSPLPLAYEEFFLGVPGVRRHVLELDKLEKKNFSKKWDTEKLIVLMGRDQYDHSPYNVASFLALQGIKNLAIVEGGAAAAFGFAERKLPERVGEVISAEDLRRLINKEQNSTLIVDCRNPATAKGALRGAVRITSKPAEQGKSEEENDDFSVAEIQKEILAKPNLKTVVFVGSSRLDPKPGKVAKQLNLKKFKVMELNNGFQEWSYFNHFVWSDQKTISKVPNHLRVAHAPPQRIYKKVEGAKKIEIEPPQRKVIAPTNKSQ